jgi:hypothetical protein
LIETNIIVSIVQTYIHNKITTTTTTIIYNKLKL